MGFLKSIIEKPGYTLMRGPARFKFARNIVSKSKASIQHKNFLEHKKKLESNFQKSLFREIDLEKLLVDMELNGCAFGLKLPRIEVEEILKYSKENPSFAYRDEKLGFYIDNKSSLEKDLGQEIMLSQYFNVQKSCKSVEKIVNDPVINWIALNYLGVKPEFLGCNLWWTFPVEPNPNLQKKHAHFFHRDIDDFKFLKFFFYITEVTKDDGAHWVVKGSHQIAPIFKLKDYFLTRRYTDEEVANFYGEDNLIEVVGAAGDGFAEDTLCVHKGATPKKNPRLLLQLQFGLFRFVPEGDKRDNSSLIIKY